MSPPFHSLVKIEVLFLIRYLNLPSTIKKRNKEAFGRLFLTLVVFGRNVLSKWDGTNSSYFVFRVLPPEGGFLNQDFTLRSSEDGGWLFNYMVMFLKYDE